MNQQEKQAFEVMREKIEKALIYLAHSGKFSRSGARDVLNEALAEANTVQPNFSDQATIAGLEASIGHLSALVNEQLLLLEEVNENLGVDGLGAELDDDQSPTIAKVREHLAAMTPPVRTLTLDTQ